jgi:3-hydroxyacyl-[acyl-carrier-protein] dehydratase
MLPGVNSFSKRAIGVPGKDLLLDLSTIDLNHVVADIETIRRYNPQRFEMEQLTAVIYEDPIERVCVGYKDVTDREFWCRGHFPALALMPGVIMCEAAAQMCSYFTQRYDLLGGAKMVGFGGMEAVRFRDTVRPGSRLYVICKQLRVRKGAIIVCDFQGVVNNSVVVDGQIKGIPLPIDALIDQAKTV